MEHTFQVLWENKFEPRNLCLAKLAVKIEDRLKPFLHLQRFREFIYCLSFLKEITENVGQETKYEEYVENEEW